MRTHSTIQKIGWQHTLFVCFCMLFMVTGTTHAMEVTPPPWFQFLDEGEHWQIQSGSVTDTQFLIIPKQKLSTGSPKRVCALFAKKSSAYNKSLNRIMSVFREKGIDAEFTVVLQPKKTESPQRVLELWKPKGNDLPFDLIISAGSGATAFVVKNYQSPQNTASKGKSDKIPVVSVCSKDPVLMDWVSDYKGGSGTNIAFTSLNISTELQLKYLQDLKENLKVIAVLYARKNKSVVLTQLEPLKKIAEQEGIAVLEVAVEDQGNAKAELTEKVPQAVKQIESIDPGTKNSLFWITGSTSVFREMETINLAAGKVPVLSVVPDNVQEGNMTSAILSIGVSFESNAHLAALYAERILTGQAAGSFDVGQVTPPDIAINFQRAAAVDLKIPFSFFESATFVYNLEGYKVREEGKNLTSMNWTDTQQPTTH